MALHLRGSKDDAQDLCQQVFLIAYKRLAEFRFDLSFRLWLYRILSGLLSKDSSKGTRNRSSSDHRDPKSGYAERESVQGAEAERIRLALRNLDRTEWIVFELRHYAGLRLRTIAEILQVSETTVTNAFCCATQNLRHALATPAEAREKQSTDSAGPIPAGEAPLRNSTGVAGRST